MATSGSGVLTLSKNAPALKFHHFPTSDSAFRPAANYKIPFHSTLLGRFHEKVAENEIIKADLVNERRSNELLRVEIAKAELRLESVPKFESNIAGLEQELLEAREVSSNLHEAAAIAEARLEAKNYQCKELENKLLQAMQERDELVNRATVAINSLENERKAASANQKRMEDAVKNLNIANETAKKAREEVAELRGQLTVMNILRSTAPVTS